MILLIRPKWFEDESWGGYLLRLSEMNGLDGVTSLSRRLNLTVIELMLSSPHHVLPRLGIHQMAPALPSQLATGKGRTKWIRLHHSGRSIYSRVCPMCLSQDQHPHVRSIWDLALNLVCKIHDRCLLDTCPNCSKPIDFLRPSISRCTCGQDFRLIDMLMVPDHLPIIERAFDVETMRSNASRAFAGKGITERFGVFVLKRLISLSNPDSCLIDHRRQGYSYSQVFRLHDLERVSEWFKDWPHGFVSGIETARASYLSAERFFRPKLLLFAHEFPPINDVLEFEAMETQRQSDENIKSAVQVIPNRVRPRDIVDIQTICKMTGFGFYVVAGWIKRGIFGEVATSVRKSGRMHYEIDGQRVRNVGLFFARTSTISKLAEVIGTESHALRRLAFAKVIPIYMVPSGTRNPRVLPEHVFGVVRRLIGLASHSTEASYSALSFSQAVFRLSQLAPQEIRKFMDDLGTEVLPLICREENPIRLDDVLVSVKDLRKWCAQQSQWMKT